MNWRRQKGEGGRRVVSSLDLRASASGGPRTLYAGLGDFRGPQLRLRSQPRPVPGGHGLPLADETSRGMRSSPRPAHGVRGLPAGFTLIEMILVLVIIAILAAVTLPGFNSAVNEHRVREDGHELAMMVRRAMIQSTEQHRTFFIELDKHNIKLFAQGDEAQLDQDADAKLFKDSGSTDTNSDEPVAMQVGVDEEQALDSPNKLMVPDPLKNDAWMDLPDAGQQWVFQPGELCPAQKVRIVRGDAYLEMDFGALTGGVDSEKFYFP